MAPDAIVDLEFLGFGCQKTERVGPIVCGVLENRDRLCKELLG
jgi:hypothetical protein